MGVNLVVAQRADSLLAPFVDWLRRPREDPFRPDVVVVPRVAVRDFLIEQVPPLVGVNGRGGILANAQFWLPEQFNRHALGGGESSLQSWSLDSLAWTILECLNRKPNLIPSFQGANRKYAVSAAIANLFGRYMRQRPEMVFSWSRGTPTDGLRVLPESARWQFELWNEVRKFLGVSPGELAIDSLRKPLAEHPLFEYADNLAFFGIDYVSPFKAKQIQRLGEISDVPVFALNISEAILSSSMPISLDVVPERMWRDSSINSDLDLLRSWARPAGEAAQILKGLAKERTFVSTKFGESLLGEVQQSISHGSIISGVEPFGNPESCSDGSIQIHKCHGAIRQVEVMRDALLHILESRADISARDVVVVCPQVERFESVVRPILEQEVDGQSLRVSVLGGSLDRESVFDTLDMFLDLATGRMKLSDVLLTLSHSAVQERFGISTEDLSQFAHWADELDIRWGLDTNSRLEAEYPIEQPYGTWSDAVERLALGLLYPNENDQMFVTDRLPYDDVGSSDFESVGRLWSFVSLVQRTRVKISQGLSHEHWADLLDSIIVDLFRTSSEDGIEQIEDLRRFSQSLRDASVIMYAASVSALDVRSALQARAPHGRGFSSYWYDGIRVGSLAALQGVGAKVVVLLGLDHGSLRQGSSDGDDILGLHPRVGDRDPRLEDRVAILSLLQAAEDYFLVICDGFDVNDNMPISSPIVLEELIGHFSRVSLASSIELKCPLVVEHSRQLADCRNLSESSSKTSIGSGDCGRIWNRPWTFDATALKIVQGRENAESVRALGLAQIDVQSNEDPSEPINLRELDEGFKDPFRLLLEKRHGILLPTRDHQTSDLVDLWPGALAYWKLGEGLLRHRLSGESTELWAKQTGAKGLLPAGRLAERLLSELDASVSEILLRVPFAWSTCISEEVSFSTSGRKVDGTIERSGVVVPHVGFSKWDPSQRLRPWIGLAALTMSEPSTIWEGLTVFRSTDVKSSGAQDGQISIERFRICGNDANERLKNATDLLDFAVWLREQALRTFVPMFRRTSWVWNQSTTTVASALSRDLSGSPLSVLYPEIDLSFLKSDPPITAGDQLPNGSCRAEQYAFKLKQLWDEGVQVTESAQKEKKGRSSK